MVGLTSSVRRALQIRRGVRQSWQRGSMSPLSQDVPAMTKPEPTGALAIPKAALLAETPDITVEELRLALVERGHSFSYGTLRRFFARRRITRKKDRARQRAGHAHFDNPQVPRRGTRAPRDTRHRGAGANPHAHSSRSAPRCNGGCSQPPGVSYTLFRALRPRCAAIPCEDASRLTLLREAG